MNISWRNRFRYNRERAVQHLLMLTCITPPPGSKFRSGRVSEPVEELGVGDVARLEEDRVPALVGVVLPAPGGSVRGERANFTGLVNGCIEANICK